MSEVSSRQFYGIAFAMIGGTAFIVGIVALYANTKQAIEVPKQKWEKQGRDLQQASIREEEKRDLVHVHRLFGEVIEQHDSYNEAKDNSFHKAKVLEDNRNTVREVQDVLGSIIQRQENRA